MRESVVKQRRYALRKHRFTERPGRPLNRVDEFVMRERRAGIDLYVVAHPLSAGTYSLPPTALSDHLIIHQVVSRLEK